MRFIRSILALFSAVVLAGLARAEALAPEKQALVDAKLAEIQALAADPAVVKAVAAQNSALPASFKEMTQEKWKTLTVLDPFVRGLTKNEAAVALKTRKAAWVSEAFVNDAKGLKVGFLSKPTNWSHATSSKHTQPMAGKVWQGAVELDESTGLQQIQISVPVLSDGAPAGSLVIGISIAKLE